MTIQKKCICEDCQSGQTCELDADTVVFAVGGAALNALVRKSPVLARYKEFRKFANLRGMGVLATRLYLDKIVDIPYSANVCWGFDKGIGQTFFDITKLHGHIHQGSRSEGSIIEVLDYYHAASSITPCHGRLDHCEKGQEGFGCHAGIFMSKSSSD